MWRMWVEGTSLPQLDESNTLSRTSATMELAWKQRGPSDSRPCVVKLASRLVADTHTGRCRGRADRCRRVCAAPGAEAVSF